jgi:hypothetical protein
MSKKKKVLHQTKRPLQERLQGCWDREDWGAFVTIYKKASPKDLERASMQKYWEPGLYNFLSTLLFSEKDPKNVIIVGEMILQDSSLSPQIRNCARIALDFWALQGCTKSVLTPLEEDERRLPPPYAKLRSSMEKILREEKKRASSTEQGKLLEKLTKQFALLPSAKNAARFTSCCKTADALYKLARETSSEEIFRALRMVMVLLRELKVPASPFRDPGNLIDSDYFNESLDITDPVLSGVWEYFYAFGEKRFGFGWGSYARTLRVAFSAKLREGLPRARKEQIEAFRKITKRPLDFFEMRTGGTVAEELLSLRLSWSPLENYFLAYVTLVNSCTQISDILLYDLEPRRITDSLNKLMKNGKMLRPEARIPKAISDLVGKCLHLFSPAQFSELLRLDFPLEEISPHLLLKMSLFSEWNMKEIQRKCEDRLPFELSEEDRKELLEELQVKNLTLLSLDCLETFLEREALLQILETWLWNVAEESMKNQQDGRSPSQQPWAKIPQSVFQKLAELFPSGTLVQALCALCSGKKQFTLLSDKGLEEVFFQALPSPPGEREFRLFLWFLSWLEVNPKFLKRLGHSTYGVCSKEKAWEKVWETLKKVRHPQRRHALAQEVAGLWEEERASRKRRNMEQEEYLEKIRKM